jgi:hypothetical protein
MAGTGDVLQTSAYEKTCENKVYEIPPLTINFLV